MRLVVFPLYSNSVNMAGCSTVNFFKDWVLQRLASDPSLFLYMILPKPDEENEKWIWNAGEFDHPRLKKLYTRVEFKQYDQMAFCTTDIYDWFNERNGQYFFDAMLTEQFSIIPLLYSITSSYVKRNSFRPLFFSYCGFLMDSTKDFSFIPEPWEMAQAIGMSMSRCFFPTKGTLDRAIAMCKKYLRNDKVLDILNNCSTVSSFINTDLIDKLITDIPRNEHKFVVNYSGRTNKAFRVEEALDIINYIYMSGKDIDVVVTSQSGTMFETKEIQKKYDWMDLKCNVPREEYLKKLASCDCSINFLKGKMEFNLTTAEQLYCGLPVVMPYDEGMVKILPEWYPRELMFDNKYEAFVSVSWLMERRNTEWYTDFRIKIKKWVKDNLGIFNNPMYDKISADVKDHLTNYKEDRDKFRSTNGVIEIVDLCLDKLPDEFSWDDFVAMAKSVSDQGIDINKPHPKTGCNKSVYYHTLIKEKCIDLCCSENPIFRKVVL